MQRESKPVKPEALGVIGKEHLKARFEAAGCNADSFQYRQVKSKEPLPEVLEFAFGYCPEYKERRLVTGVNWSPGIINPFRRLNNFQSLDGILSEDYCGPAEPIIVFLHVASP